jgi:hypothetical protein
VKLHGAFKGNVTQQQIKRMENSWVLPEKQNQIAVVGRFFASPPVIMDRWAL